MLLGLTIWINVFALTLALWLGLYLVTRSTRTPAAWLFALAIWSTGGIFLNQLLALHPPSSPSPENEIWVYHLILFWPRNVFELGWRGWLQGWLPAYGIAFWYHATLSIRPGRFKLPLLTALPGYMIVLAGILLKARYLSTWMNPAASSLYTSSMPGFIFGFDAIGWVIFASLSLVNLGKADSSSGHTMSRQHLRLYLIAALAAGAAGLAGFISKLLAQPIPRVWEAALLSLALILGGVGVARQLVSSDRASLQRDFLFSASGAAVVVACGMLVLGAITLFIPLPFMTVVWINCLLLIIFMLIDGSQVRIQHLPIFRAGHLMSRYLPQLFLWRKNGGRDMERALRQLAGLTGAAWVIVLRSSEQGMLPVGSWKWKGKPLEDLYAGAQTGALPENHASMSDTPSPPFDQAALILPLYHHGQEQAGVLLAGAPFKEAEYTSSQLSAFHDAMRHIAGLVAEAGDGKRGGMTTTSTSSPGVEERAGRYELIQTRQVELALRNLHDYAYLADLPLADLRLVRDCSDIPEYGMNSFVHRGKALSSVLTEAVVRLKPDQGDPPDAPPRSWYPYLLLSKAYLEGISNRDIMSQLYISEGTFNRTRRAAIQFVARILEEMEASLVDYQR
jgi:hypothetical protein